jgi:hypothetical protein
VGTLARDVLAGLLILVGGYIVLVQLFIFLSPLWSRSTTETRVIPSYIPILGPLFFQAGSWVLPAHWLRSCSWVGWPLDVGTWLLLMHLLKFRRPLRK